jgi:hypothetical protein
LWAKKPGSRDPLRASICAEHKWRDSSAANMKYNAPRDPGSQVGHMDERTQIR